MLKYCETLNKKLFNHNVRTKVDTRNESMGFKIRDAQTKKVPYTVVIGENEMKEGKVTYRIHGHKDTRVLKENEFVRILLKDIKKKASTRSYLD